MMILFTVYTTCGWFLCSWERRQYNILYYGLYGGLNRRLNPHEMWRRWVRRSIPIGHLTVATLPTLLLPRITTAIVLRVHVAGPRPLWVRARARPGASKCIVHHDDAVAAAAKVIRCPPRPGIGASSFLSCYYAIIPRVCCIFRLFWFYKNLYIVVIKRMIMI